MPAYRTLTMGQYKVWVRPMGIRRCLRFWPYFNGTNVTIILNVKNKTNDVQDIIYEWNLLRWDGQRQSEVDKGKDIFTFEAYGLSKQKMRLPYLAVPGEYIVQLKLITSKKEDHAAGTMEISDWLAVATFGVLERDKVNFYAFITVGSLVLGVLLTLLTQWIRSIIG